LTESQNSQLRTLAGGEDRLHRWAWVTALGVCLLTAGCATVPHAAVPDGPFSEFSFSVGRGTQLFASPPPLVIAALDQALVDLEIVPVQHTRDGTVLRVEAKTKDNRRVAATIRAYAGTSQVAIRIGRFGDEPLSRSILQRVDIRLGSRDPEAIPGTPPSTPAHNPFFSRDAVPDSDMLRDFVEAPYRDRVIP
jgi:hypothetical protein